MKGRSSLFLLCGILLFTGELIAQDSSNNAAQTADELRAKLHQVQAKEAELQDRAKQLEEDLKPENIERSLAGVGSTRPEELRELRRRQLNIEKASVSSQLEQLAAQRTRLQSAIVTADTAAYHQSAQRAPQLNQVGLGQYVTNPRWLVGTVAFVFALGAITALIVVVRRLS